MKLRYTFTARGEIAAILSRIAADNPTAASSVAGAIKATVARLRSFPFIGAETDDRGVYMRIARPNHYLIFYQIVDETVIIRNVRHPARRRPPQR
jgi:plasmid stabilization system protein ParE